jgi:type VI secretion system protein ImpL
LAKGGGAAQISAASGAVTDDYAQRVLPLCRSVTQDRYPFFSASANDLSSMDAQRVFGLGGIMDQFVSQRLAPILNTDGPVWRWREDDPVAATLDPATPDQFAKAGEVRALIANGLTLRIELVSLAGADAVTFQAGDSTYRFDAAAKGPKQIRWSLQGGIPEAGVILHKGPDELSRKTTEGIWALFRLMEQAQRENAGPTAFLATFGDTVQGATLRVVLPDERNPFSKGGMWTFRCPTAL